jgi:hypothetical protein
MFQVMKKPGRRTVPVSGLIAREKQLLNFDPATLAEDLSHLRIVSQLEHSGALFVDFGKAEESADAIAVDQVEIDRLSVEVIGDRGHTLAALFDLGHFDQPHAGFECPHGGVHAGIVGIGVPIALVLDETGPDVAFVICSTLAVGHSIVYGSGARQGRS